MGWAVAVVLVMPLWGDLLGPAALPFPNLDWLGLAGLFASGALLGAQPNIPLAQLSPG